MAITISNARRESVGSLWAYSGDFTTDSGDSTLTVTHKMNYVAKADVDIQKGGVGAQNPKVTHSGGVMTMVFDDTLGYSGSFYIVGK